MSKKTETIEIRVSPEMKSALAAASDKADSSMSAYVRDLMEQATCDASKPETGAIAMSKLLPKSFSSMTLATLPVLAVAGFALMGTTSALTASPEYRMMFAEYDQDGDGKISEAEFVSYFTGDAVDADMPALPAECASFEEEIGDTSSEAAAREEFSYFDRNGNNAVTYDELTAVLQRERAELFLEMDSNEDGILTAEELSVEMSITGEAEDEALSAEEEACFTALERAFGDDDADGVNAAFAAEVDQIDPELETRLLIAEFDVNRDGKVTLDEFLSNL